MLSQKITATIKKFLIPHEHNDYHPHSIRISSIAAYLVITILLNYMVFPIFGWNKTEAATSNISTAQLVDLLNYSRTNAGLDGLSIDDKLVNAAIAKANDIFSNQYWSHFGPNSQTPWQFIKGAGYSYSIAGENLGRGFKDAYTLHSAWLNSPSHKSNLLKKEYKNVGIAAVTGKLLGEETTLVVQMFGAPTNNTNVKLPTINTPLDESRIMSKDINITGISQYPSNIDIYDKDKKIGSLLSEGGVFEYSATNQLDGTHEYKIKETKKDDPLIINESNDVSVIVDTSPILTKTQSLFLKYSKDINIVGKFSSDVKSVIVKLRGTEINISEILTKGSYTITQDNLNNSSEIVVEVLEADNKKDTFNLPIAYANKPIVPIASLSTEPKITSFFESFNNKQKVNLVIAFVVGVFFIVDAFVLWRLNIKVKRNSGKSIFHAQNFAMVAILIIVGTNIGGKL